MKFTINKDLLEVVSKDILSLQSNVNYNISSDNIIMATDSIIKILLPNRTSASTNSQELTLALEMLYEEVSKVLDKDLPVSEIINKLLESIPTFRKNSIADIESSFKGDPAATSLLEVEISYPGVFAVAAHRIANFLYSNKVPLLPRIISEWSHSKTGIDIHPGASIGEGLFIDHGTGVVIGETCIIGDRVKIYQGVTLGAKSFPVDADGSVIKGLKRHPTVEDDVIIYANATILGGDTVIGKSSVIGGNSFIFNSVEPKSLVNYQR